MSTEIGKESYKNCFCNDFNDSNAENPPVRAGLAGAGGYLFGVFAGVGGDIPQRRFDPKPNGDDGCFGLRC